MRLSEFINEGKNGPHSGKEVEMMISGTKPAALVSPKQKLLLDPYIKSGQLVAMQKYNNPSWIIAQKDEAWRLEKISDLLKKRRRLGRIWFWSMAYAENRISCNFGKIIRV